MSSMSLALTSLFRRPLPVPTITRSPRLPEAERVSNTGIAAGHVRRDDVQLDVELVFDDLGEPAALLQTLAAGQRVEDLDGHFGTVVLGVGTVAAAAAGRERQQRSSRNASRNRAGGDFLQFYAETSLYSFF